MITSINDFENQIYFYSFWQFFPIKQTNLKVCGYIACRRTASIGQLFARREPVDHVERRLWLVVGHHVTCVPNQDLGEVSDLLGVTYISRLDSPVLTLSV